MSRWFLRASLLAALCAWVSSANAPSWQNPVQIEPFILQTFDGKEYPAERGKLTVPEDRNSASGRTIQVAFVRLSHRGEQAGTPVVFLPPGPGVPATILGRVPV